MFVCLFDSHLHHPSPNLTFISYSAPFWLQPDLQRYLRPFAATNLPSRGGWSSRGELPNGNEVPSGSVGHDHLGHYYTPRQWPGFWQSDPKGEGRFFSDEGVRYPFFFVRIIKLLLCFGEVKTMVKDGLGLFTSCILKQVLFWGGSSKGNRGCFGPKKIGCIWGCNAALLGKQKNQGELNLQSF